MWNEECETEKANCFTDKNYYLNHPPDIMDGTTEDMLCCFKGKQ